MSRGGHQPQYWQDKQKYLIWTSSPGAGRRAHHLKFRCSTWRTLGGSPGHRPQRPSRVERVGSIKRAVRRRRRPPANARSRPAVRRIRTYPRRARTGASARCLCARASRRLPRSGLGEGKGPIAVGWVARQLGVDPHDAEMSEQPGADLAEAVPRGRRHDEGRIERRWPSSKAVLRCSVRRCAASTSVRRCTSALGIW
jgi:hypothetical protein